MINPAEVTEECNAMYATRIAAMPCPFCGGNAIRQVNATVTPRLHSYVCDGWGCEIKPGTKEYESAAVALSVWNKRK